MIATDSAGLFTQRTDDVPKDLFPNTPDKYKPVLLETKDILCDAEFNVRGRIDRMSCIDLANDIKRNGLDTPIVVRPYSRKPGFKYQIIAGHRRFTAFSINGDSTIPAIVRPDMADDYKASAMNLRENIQRAQLNFAMEAKRVNYFAQGGFSQKEIAKMLGTTPGWVEPRKRLMELPPYVLDEAAADIVKPSHVQMLYAARNDPARMLEIVREIKMRAEKGEKVIEIKSPETLEDLNKERKPKPSELADFRVLIYNLITSKNEDGEEYFPHVLLSWMMGDVSRMDMYDALERECERLGRPFKLPSEVAKLLEKPSEVPAN